MKQAHQTHGVAASICFGGKCRPWGEGGGGGGGGVGLGGEGGRVGKEGVGDQMSAGG